MRFTKTNLYITYLILFVILLSASALFNGCTHVKDINNGYKPSGDTVADGGKLVKKYCTSCHELVPADALTKDVWKFHALPSMAHYLGLSTYGTEYFKKRPDSAGVSLLEWQAIQNYYKKVAPQNPIPPKPAAALLNDWAGFTLKKPEAGKDIAYTTLVAVDSSTHKLYTSDFVTNKLYEWNSDLKGHVIASLPSGAVSATFVKNKNGAHQGVFSCIGQIMQMDFPDGRVMKVNLDKAGSEPELIQSDLQRPVQTLTGDFNKDGLSDWVILGQGLKLGGVYLFEQNADHTFKQSIISKSTGAVQAVAGDFNNDGWPDLMVLFGSGNEGLQLFLNNHNGGFTARRLLRFPPVYGSSSFQLVDMNHDGKPDLVYTCGYNYHDSRILKPYHGLYIFTNQGDWNFKQSYFYPIDGCTKAIAADFDGDGDIDIATSAFFADMKNKPAEEFIYFEQDRPMSFKPHAIPVSKYGHWMCMDAGDMNGDGKTDIVLGNYAEGFMFQQNFKPAWDTKLPFIVLENHNRK